MRTIETVGYEFLSGTMAEAIEKLAEVASGRRSHIEKTADGFLSSLGSTIKDNPALSHALVGGGLGAAAGGISTAVSNRGKDDSDRKGLLGSMATGGLMGAAAGGGVGLARQGLSNLSAGGGGMGSDALKPGQYMDPATGKMMSIDPQALKNDPELHAKVKALTTPTLQSKITGTVGGVLEGIREKTPWSSVGVPAAMAVDTALHAPGVGLAHATPETAGGYYGRKWLASGASEHGGLSDEMKKTFFENKAPGTNGGKEVSVPGHTPQAPGGSWLSKMKDKLTGSRAGKGITDILGYKAGPGVGDSPAMTVKSPEMRDVEQTSYPMTKDPISGKMEPDKSSPSKWTEREPALGRDGNPRFREESLSHGTLGDLKGVGAKADEKFKDRSMFRIPKTNRMYPGMKTTGGALGMRAAGYATLFAAEYLTRGLMEDANNRQSLRELMQQHTKPVPEPGG